MGEKLRVAIGDGAHLGKRLLGETLRLHFLVYPLQGVVSKHGSTVRAGEKGKYLWQPASVLGKGHIRSANKAVARADDRSDRGKLSLAG